MAALPQSPLGEGCADRRDRAAVQLGKLSGCCRLAANGAKKERARRGSAPLAPRHEGIETRELLRQLRRVESRGLREAP